jgi:hypothetical protein
MDKVEKVHKGEVVRSKIGILVLGLEFETGESIRLKVVQVCGKHQGTNNFGTTESNDNKEKLVVRGGS